MKAFYLIVASITLSSPLSAAEVGVRHTHGHTNSQVHSGRSFTRSNSHGSFVEISGGTSTGHNSGSSYGRVETGGYNIRSRESFGFSSHTNSHFSENSAFSN